MKNSNFPSINNLGENAEKTHKKVFEKFGWYGKKQYLCTR